MKRRRLAAASLVIGGALFSAACSDVGSGTIAAKPTPIPASNFEVIQPITTAPTTQKSVAVDGDGQPVVDGSSPDAGDEPAVSTQPSGTYVYVVQRGDSWGKLLGRLQITAEQLINANGWSWRQRLITGMQLKVPGTPPPTTIPARCKIEYTVRSGDVLGRLLRKYKTSEADFLKNNNLTARPALHAGQVYLFRRC